jgi:hypothetical protein
MKKQELFDNLLKANLEIVRLKGEIGNVLHMMEPIVSNGEDDCLCIDAPWHYSEDDEEYDPDKQDVDNPSNHSRYCPFYFQAYLRALADGAELPQ